MAKKILVVDDDEMVLIAIQELLTPLGFSMTIMSNGPGALEKAAGERFDLVILDVIMPEMDGFEVCRRIRRMEFYTETPIVMLTAKSAEEDKQRGMEAGANLYLPKPISPRRLIALVEEALR
ncbi:MAG TPA: response regulator [Thermodesulfobacteriota bacterium]|nr:response regulator [Thermodesulfobacteriota bacterium]